MVHDEGTSLQHVILVSVTTGVLQSVLNALIGMRVLDGVVGLNDTLDLPEWKGRRITLLNMEKKVWSAPNHVSEL